MAGRTRHSSAGGPEADVSVSIGTWHFDATAERLDWSVEAERLLGVQGGPNSTLDAALAGIHSDDRSTLRERIERGVDVGDPFELEVRLDDDEAGAVVYVAGSPEREDGEVVGLRGVVEDVSERVQLEQRIEVLRDASQDLMHAEDEREVAEILAAVSKNILGYVNTTVRLADEDDEMLEVYVATEECLERAGERPDYPVDEDTPASRTYRTGEPELHQDHSATQDERDRGELLSGLYVPVGHHGVMSSGDTQVAAFDQSDVEAAELLGQLGADAITRIESQRELRAQNETLSEFIENMTANIEEVTATSHSVESLAATAVERAEDGDDAIGSVARQMDDIESQVDTAVEEIDGLNEVVDEIVEIVDLIDDIADQTNVLALNASIEAARAGDAGQGFVVVAEEVKNLAEETQEATDEIETLIRNVETHTEHATEGITETTDYVAAGREATGRASELLGDIVEAIAETSDGVAEIHEAMEEQADSLEDVAGTVDE